MKNYESILDKFATPDNVTVRDFKNGSISGKVLLLADLTSAATLRALIYALEDAKCDTLTVEAARRAVLYEAEVKVVSDEKEGIDALTSGDALVFIEGERDFLTVNAKFWDKRAVSEPPTETVTKGPREGFIEDIKTNLSLLGRRLRSPSLAVERLKVGRLSNTSVAVCYLSTVAKPELIERVINKIKNIDIDVIQDSHYIVPYLEERMYSLFSEIGTNEKPDIVASKLAEGRIAVIVDGSPVVLTVPHIVLEDFQAGEDYYSKSAYVGFLRTLRILGLAFAVLLPAIYTAIENFHYSVLPLKFMLTLIGAIKGIPLSPTLETLFVILLFEIIREASVRMPRSVGMAMSIVGALVLGETAVRAGIISSPAVMIVALSSLALYTVPNLVGAMSVLRIAFTLLGGLCGVYGIILGGIYLAFYLVQINSYSTPFLAPLAPLIKNDLKDAVMREPLPKLKSRPQSIPNINKGRQK